MQGFEYPTKPHVRRHGPSGYKTYESYRKWLRDEFLFRCVYCLHRERWDTRGATFHVDHLIPVSVDPLKKTDYSNLLYACGTCNEAKNNLLGIPDPCTTAFADCLRMRDDGQFVALNRAGEALVQILRLNKRTSLDTRQRWIRALGAIREADPELYREYMGFPDDLPDLRKKKVQNSKPEGLKDCYFARRERGELPTEY